MHETKGQEKMVTRREPKTQREEKKNRIETRKQGKRQQKQDVWKETSK